MIANGAFWSIPLASLTACGMAMAAEWLLKPRPRFIGRPAGAWSAHCGAISMVCSLLCLLTGRPLCSLGICAAIVLTLVLVSNAKYASMREIFIFQDWDYFVDALRYPRLFLPFFGVKNFLLATAAFLCGLAMFTAEIPPGARWTGTGQGGGMALTALLSAVLLLTAVCHPPRVRFSPQEDVRDVGFFALLWIYGCSVLKKPAVASPFAALSSASAAYHTEKRQLPHLIAVQNESFFDVRTLPAGIRADVLAGLDAISAEACLHGSLSVPAWGANTVRTEFSFLTGIAPDALGGHRFSPYRLPANGWPVASLASLLKQRGYRTVMLHPYHKEFYLRDKVMPLLGFDEFVDIAAFSPADTVGHYVSDAAVGQKILDILAVTDRPTFIFAVTMENHGPVEPCPSTTDNIFMKEQSVPCAARNELHGYIKHLRNADALIQNLHAALRKKNMPISLAWYGDHVPMLAETYKTYGDPAGDVPFFCWANMACQRAMVQNASIAHCATEKHCSMPIHELALRWLQNAGVLQ